MTDHLNKTERSWNMSRIKGIDTKPEMKVRRLLYSMGYRYRLHKNNLPGKPDIIIEKYKLIIQVHGCYWHRHQNCKLAYNPKSRVEFWQKKFDDNVSRDNKVKRELLSLGYSVYTIWECETRDTQQLSNCIRNILDSKVKRHVV